MVELKTDSLMTQPVISVSNIKYEKTIKEEKEHISPTASCSTHGPSQTPLLDRELQTERAQDIIGLLAKALNNVTDGTKCTKCTVDEVSALLTDHVKSLRLAKQNGEWSKEERKTLKAEVKLLFKPVKKGVTSLWKANS
ncbi:hypothetical protein N7532_005919 [Penicillium argentinense]|uniref:Uncharacterized protein n=1 Tax=Penicillium argentinense TaxID=1131581 RepID=A0A9W9FET4_9EURO|nr:uncharacterized protein N7532_005919 [Penicillium argentinense]KAJ5098918.1 hypothetical protein N7532_005919 [Penicillium argentinense]